jgi:anion-transporting  ArsA/GET3 family ATPase
MSLVITFLGKGGTGRTTIAIATAKKLASLGAKVLLVGADPSPAFSIALGVPLEPEPKEIATNFAAVQLQSTFLLEKGWEQLKELEKQYLQSPILKNVYSQELAILPGMDRALALNAIREYDEGGKYDVIVYDGLGDVSELRTVEAPETMSWYVRRFRNVLLESDIYKALSPFIQPITSAVFNVAWNGNNFGGEPLERSNQLLDKGKAVLADPKRIIGYLVSDDSPAAIAMAKYLWGSAQQAGLTVGGLLLNRASTTEMLAGEFAPLNITSIPNSTDNNWQAIVEALPDFRQTPNVPKPLNIDITNRQVKVFLPGFDKKQVKLTQSGPEITIEAGDRRRNIILPPPLNGQPVKGAKFQDGYLIISL